jgi:fluoroquinolone transport system ATP-binding protein
MNDADELCDRVGFIVEGKLTLIESPRELKIRHGKKIVKLEYLKDGELEKQDFDLKNLAANNRFLNLLRTGNVQTIHTAEATLDDIFIKATGRQLK